MTKNRIIKNSGYPVCVKRNKKNYIQYSAYIPDFEVYTQGEDIKSCLINAYELIRINVQRLNDHNMAIPRPSGLSYKAKPDERLFYIRDRKSRRKVTNKQLVDKLIRKKLDNVETDGSLYVTVLTAEGEKRYLMNGEANFYKRPYRKNVKNSPFKKSKIN